MSAARRGTKGPAGTVRDGGAGHRARRAAGVSAGGGRLTLVAGVALVALVVLTGLVSLVWTPYDPDAMEVTNRFALPSAAHLFGTDQYGRDICARVMVAARPALLVGLGSVGLGAVVGTLVGAAGAMAGGVVRAFIMRLVDGVMAFPGILLAMMLVLVVGRGLTSALIAIALFMVPTFARLSYGLTMEARGTLWLKAAQSYGSSRMRIVTRHVLPVVLPRIVTTFTANVGAAMLLESSLSFLGLGVQPPTASWGMMLSEALPYVTSYPVVAVAPGVALMLAALGFNLLGDALNDRLVKAGVR